MTDESRERLEFFVEKSDKLLNSKFVKSAANDGLHLKMNARQGGSVSMEQIRPDLDSVDALVLTLRFFIQDNEPISLRKMTKLLDDPGLSQTWKDRYSAVRNTLNSRLDQPPTSVQPKWAGEKLTCREILYGFVYGELAHSDEAKRQQYQEWKSNQWMFQFIEYAFLVILVDFLQTVGYLAAISRKELEGAPILPIEG